MQQHKEQVHLLNHTLNVPPPVINMPMEVTIVTISTNTFLHHPKIDIQYLHPSIPQFTPGHEVNPNLTYAPVQNTPRMVVKYSSWVPTPPYHGLIIAKALYDYNAAIPEECSFRKSDVVLVTRTQDDGWWVGEITGSRPTQRGLVPRLNPPFDMMLTVVIFSRRCRVRGGVF
jgi:hypothetical protein